MGGFSNSIVCMYICGYGRGYRAASISRNFWAFLKRPVVSWFGLAPIPVAADADLRGSRDPRKSILGVAHLSPWALVELAKATSRFAMESLRSVYSQYGCWAGPYRRLKERQRRLPEELEHGGADMWRIRLLEMTWLSAVEFSEWRYEQAGLDACRC